MKIKIFIQLREAPVSIACLVFDFTIVTSYATTNSVVCANFRHLQAQVNSCNRMRQYMKSLPPVGDRKAIRRGKKNLQHQ